MPTLEQQVKDLQTQVRTLQDVAAAIQGKPASALISIPHNDSWLISDNVDPTHPLNIRYVIASNVQRVVRARLSFFLAAYRTYSNFSVTATGAGTAHAHNHNHGSHAHSIHLVAGAGAGTVSWGGAGAGFFDNTSPTGDSSNINGATPAADATAEASHTHTVSGSSFLGVTEGAVATGVTISFEGVDQTVALNGPFSTAQVELDVLRLMATTTATYHTIAMTPSGLGRIEAHLSLSYYAAAGSAF